MKKGLTQNNCCGIVKSENQINKGLESVTEDYFLSERGSHRLKASLSSDNS